MVVPFNMTSDPKARPSMLAGILEAEILLAVNTFTMLRNNVSLTAFAAAVRPSKRDMSAGLGSKWQARDNAPFGVRAGRKATRNK
jgi:hypothetical protein